MRDSNSNEQKQKNPPDPIELFAVAQYLNAKSQPYYIFWHDGGWSGVRSPMLEIDNHARHARLPRHMQIISHRSALGAFGDRSLMRITF